MNRSTLFFAVSVVLLIGVAFICYDGFISDTSDEATESPEYSISVISNLPDARYRFATAYDEENGYVYLYGGGDTEGPKNTIVRYCLDTGVVRMR